ncbi:MAG: DUF4338 domain-containing protein [Deltaproteobacteria bacterium]|nr:DUF4338 domain-containing protein [Deltaproteobacteria bacterium]
MLGYVRDHLPVTITIANKTDSEVLCDQKVRQYYYLGFGKMIGQHVKYLSCVGSKPVAALSFNRAALHVGVRDAYIGWTDEGRRQNLKFIVSNHRFLILPWVNVKNLASHLLGRCLRMLPDDWSELYGYAPELAETFVDSEHYKGTCYLASNWKLIGETKWFSKIGNQFSYHELKKKVFLYELNKRFIPSLPSNLRRPPLSDPWKEIKMLMSMPYWNNQFFDDLGLNENNITVLQDDLFEFLNLIGHVFQQSSFNIFVCIPKVF